MDSLRVRWVPLLQSFQRLGAFASVRIPLCPALPSSDSYAPSDTYQGHGSFVGLSLSYCPLSFPFLGLPCSQ